MHEDDLALARMDDDGHGCAITAPPRPVFTAEVTEPGSAS